MRNRAAATVTSLLSILFMTLHLADDITRGMEPGGPTAFTGILILAIWLYGTLVLPEQRSGQVVILLGSILGVVVPLVHMQGEGLVGRAVAGSSGVFFWVFALISLGVAAFASVIFSAQALWNLRPGGPGRLGSA